MGSYLEFPAQVIREAVPLDPTEHLLHKAILPSLRNIEALPNTWKATQEGYQNEKTRKYVPNERTKQNS